MWLSSGQWDISGNDMWLREIVFKGKGHCPFFDFLSPAGWNSDMMAGGPVAILDNKLTLRLEDAHDGATR